MKKLVLVLAIAVALTFAMTAVAFADHSPTFYVKWDTTTNFTSYNGTTWGNAGSGSPHQNYLEGTAKCAVCHSVHRAPVVGAAWSTADSGGDGIANLGSAETSWPGAPDQGQLYKRTEFAVTTQAVAAGGTTQMLLMSDVANACDYCHIDTALGGKQLYAGKRQYRTEGTGLAGAEWDAGYAHHNGCTGCHAVHGASSNYGDAALYGAYGTFQGPAKSKILKVRAKGAGGAGNQAYVWQDETIVIGSAGRTEFASGTIAGADTWALAQTADDAAVDPKNVPLFPSSTDAINGTNVRPGTDAYNAQTSVFCTFCHQNYGYASEATVNPDYDRSLFQGPWHFLAGSGAINRGVAGTWENGNTADGNGPTFKNHPVKKVDGNFVASGKTAAATQVAFADADTCITCHDAGVRNQTGLIVESYPHFTPGYFQFQKTGARVGAGMTYAPMLDATNVLPDRLSATDTANIAAVQTWLEDEANYDMSVNVADGSCLKCHVNAAGTAGVGMSF